MNETYDNVCSFPTWNSFVDQVSLVYLFRQAFGHYSKNTAFSWCPEKSRAWLNWIKWVVNLLREIETIIKFGRSRVWHILPQPIDSDSLNSILCHVTITSVGRPFLCCSRQMFLLLFQDCRFFLFFQVHTSKIDKINKTFYWIFKWHSF